MSKRFWPSATVEPKRKFRWIAQLGVGEKIQSFVIKKVGKPEWSVANKEHKILGHTFNYPGPVTWAPVDITILDIAGAPTTDDIPRGKVPDMAKPGANNTTHILKDLMYASGYVFPEGGPTPLES